MSQTRVSPEDLLKPGQKVLIAIMATFVAEVDIKDYLDGSGDSNITVEELQSDIRDNMSITDILDEWNVRDITVEPEVSAILDK